MSQNQNYIAQPLFIDFLRLNYAKLWLSITLPLPASPNITQTRLGSWSDGSIYNTLMNLFGSRICACGTEKNYFWLCVTKTFVSLRYEIIKCSSSPNQLLIRSNKFAFPPSPDMAKMTVNLQYSRFLCATLNRHLFHITNFIFLGIGLLVYNLIYQAGKMWRKQSGSLDPPPSL